MSPLTKLTQGASAALTKGLNRVEHKWHHANSASRPHARGMMLYAEDLTVSFDGFKALNNLTFYLQAGELRCFIGPNGAGKTTMMDVLTGRTRPDSGNAFFCSDPQHESPDNLYNLLQMDEVAIVRAGIGRKFQKPSVIESLSVGQNLELAGACNKTVRGTLKRGLDSAEQDYICEILQKIRLSSRANVLAGTLSHGQKQWLEIGMLLIQRPRLLMLDEPAAGMTPEEIELSIELLHELKGRHTIMVIEHDMAFIRAIADIVTVLCRGQVLAEGTMDEVSSNPAVIEAYLGKDDDA
ncbi:MAG: urea ABC transporter ATP-binding protein UrtD [Candidatus Anaerobiospirillum merdipullorum]|uniref:Urea ABC transporter ATP-binding protein UrtD n=1 Tax=Candidatus Anaerobiospirillum merdipullorum TaxID=2838450 RepID=A0A9E2KNJ7_9GAMM|nr:urea ABC transporter ATP-binding protein UrtD [Candidatus Anaerobiospirillum merdipullorum]